MSLRAYKIAAVLVGAVFLVSGWLLYKGDFRSLRTEAQKVDAIVEYASADPEDADSLRHRMLLHPVVEFDEVFGSRRILVFSDSEVEGLLGRIQFRRGVLGGWQPLSAFYTTYTTPFAMQSTAIGDEGVRVVYGLHCPPEVAAYRVQANLNEEETCMAAGAVTEANFFHVYETDRSFFPAIYLFDAEGDPLDESAYLVSDQSRPSPSIGSAETGLVYVLCVLWLGLGWLIAKYLWAGGSGSARPPDTAPKENETA